MKLLDTDILVAWLRGDKDAQAYLVKHISEAATSTLSAAELYDGAATAARSEAGFAEVDRLLAALPMVPFGPRHARVYGPVRAQRRKLGLPGGPLDLLIASIALGEGATVVTRNRRDFEGINGLAIVAW